MMLNFKEKRISTYDSVINLLINNREAVSSIRAFSYSISRLGQVINSIKKKDREFKTELNKKILRSNTTRDQLIMYLIPVVNALIAFGKKSKNPSIKCMLGKHSLVYLLTIEDNQLLAKAVLIKHLAEEYHADIKKYMITHNYIHLLKLKIDEFKVVNKCKNEKTFLNFLTDDSVDELFREADKLLNSFDSFMEDLSTRHSEFYNSYITARNLKHRGSFKSSPIKHN